MSDCPQAFDPHFARMVYRRKLPHWRQPGAAYFLTFRLADSLPLHVLRQWSQENEQWTASHPSPFTDEQRQEQINKYGRKLLTYLDNGFCSCMMKAAAIREHVASAMLHFDRERYLLGQFAIMPNHVHALVMPLGDWDLTTIAASWMRYSAVRINRDSGHAGRFWQSEPFDHIARDRVAFGRFTKYIQDNPLKAAEGQAECGRGSLCWE